MIDSTWNRGVTPLLNEGNAISRYCIVAFSEELGIKRVDVLISLLLIGSHQLPEVDFP